MFPQPPLPKISKTMKRLLLGSGLKLPSVNAFLWTLSERKILWLNIHRKMAIWLPFCFPGSRRQRRFQLWILKSSPFRGIFILKLPRRQFSSRRHSRGPRGRKILETRWASAANFKQMAFTPSIQ